MLTLKRQKTELMPCYFREKDGVTTWHVDYVQVLTQWFPKVVGPEEWFAAYDALFGKENGDAANIPAVPESDRQ